MNRDGFDEASRAQRWKVFRRRADHAPQNVYRHRTRGWEYVPMQPFGDEPDDLLPLNLQPESCWSVDAWWGIDGDATLLESAVVAAAQRLPGLYAKPASESGGGVYLVAVFDAPFVTREQFEQAMTRFADAGFPRDARFELRQGDPWLRVDGPKRAE